METHTIFVKNSWRCNVSLPRSEVGRPGGSFCVARPEGDLEARDMSTQRWIDDGASA